MSLTRDPQAFAALRCPNFRLFLIGQMASLTGLWMKRLTMSWLVYRLTLSGLSLGIIEILSTAPLIFLGFFAGTWLETHDLRKTLIITQLLSLIEVLILAILSLTNTISFTIIGVMALFLGLIYAVDLPCRQSSVSVLVDKPSQLKSAIALHSIVFNVSRLVGPSIAGFVIYRWGETVCFFLCAMAYLPVVYMLIFSIKFRERQTKSQESSQKTMLQSMQEGLRYVRSQILLYKTFLLLMPFSFFTGSQIALFPLFAAEILHGNAQVLGMLYGAVGLGAILSGLFLALFIPLSAIPKSLVFSISLTSACFILFANATSLSLALPVAFFLGFGMISSFISTNTLLQTVAPEDKRSRIMSLYTLGPAGLGPLGALCAGASADMIGAPITMAASGLAVFLALIAYLPSVKASTQQLLEFSQSNKD